MKNYQHIVIGAGATGVATARQLAHRGENVAVISRSGAGPNLDGVDLIQADANDTNHLIELTGNGEVLYNCASPPYHRWRAEWPALAASILAAAQANDLVLSTLSNLYMYANPTRPMRATDPADPSSVKGQVRASMWEQAKAAHDAGQVRVTEARASDFIGPGIGSNGVMGDRVVPRVLNGKSVSLVGQVDVDHSWTALEDVAATLIAIGGDERAWGRPWHVPTAAPLSQTQFIHKLCAQAGVEPVEVKTLPRAIVGAIGLFSPAMRELREVAYQFSAPFVIDSSETTEQLGLQHSPIEETIDATLVHYRSIKSK